VRQAIAENTTSLGREMGHEMSDRVIKEMNYLMRMQEEQEEERYRKLDETICSHYRKKRTRQKEQSSMLRRDKKLKPKLTV
jgi:hypothetical protein